MRLILKIRFFPTFESWFFGLNVKPMLLGLSGVVYFIWMRRVKNTLPVTSELYAEWQWNLTHFEINISWEDTKIVFKMKHQFCWCQQKLSRVPKWTNFCPKVVFFNYIAINANKTTNNYPRSSSWDFLTRPLTEHSILQFSLLSADVS